MANTEQNTTTKKGPIKKVKDWWKSIDPITRTWLGAVGIWFVDGILIGSIVTSTHNGVKHRKAIETAKSASYREGKFDAYSEMLDRAMSYNVRESEKF